MINNKYILDQLQNLKIMIHLVNKIMNNNKNLFNNVTIYIYNTSANIIIFFNIIT